MSLLKARYVGAAALSVLVVASLGYLRGAQATPSNVAGSVAVAAAQRFGCVHTEVSEWDCPDTTFRIMDASSEIDSASVAVTRTDGQTSTYRLPQGTDAVFLTRSAVVRFLLPYYTRTDPRKARQLRARLQAYSSCVHTEPSEWHCPQRDTFTFVPSRTASVSMTVTTARGQPRTSPLPWGADAVFLTRPAVDRFLLSYYDRVDAPKARRLRSHLRRYWPRP